MTQKEFWLIKSGDIATGEVKSEDIGDYQVLDRHIATGEVKSKSIADYQIIDRTIATGEIKSRAIEDGAVETPKVADYAIIDSKIATGEVKARALNIDQGEGLVDDVGTEFAHNLGVEPVILDFIPTTDGVMGYLQESARSATSVTLKANVSGVYAKWTVFA